MAGRISPAAAPGSLLKGEQPARKRKDKRERKPDHLALVRRLPCLACDNDPACEAAHLRISNRDKPVTGIGIKPADHWALPLCRVCHMEQHATGERPFWRTLGLNPFLICMELWGCRSIEEMRAVIFRAREQRK